MSEEEAPPAAPATEEAPVVEEIDGGAPADGENQNGDRKKNGRGDRKRDETPIEELFDLTQPIPRVEKPSKEAHEKAVAEITEAVKALQDERRQVQEKIDVAMNDPEAKSKLQENRAKLNTLKTKKNGLIEQKKVMRSQLDKVKNENEKILKDKKDARSNVKYSSVEEIDKEIAKLERKQETTSMSLSEEKRLIKEIDALTASKKFVSDIKNKDAAIDDIKAQRKNLGEQIGAKDKEIDALTAEINEVMGLIKEMNDKEDVKRDNVKELFKERDNVRKQIGDKLKEKDSLRDEFREKNNAWYNYQRALRAQKKMQYEKEKAERDAARAEYEAKLAAEEAKKIPYEEEQNLCDFLADYLERVYLGKTKEAASSKKEDFVAVKDDPFAGFKPVNKKADEEYFGKGKGKKKRVRATKKQDAPGPFTLSVDMFEQFGMIMLDPPTKIDEVEKSVKELREKKEWYKQQPRGSVPTAQDIRKSKEKKAVKVKAEVEQDNGAKTPTVKAASAFSLKSDDFVPLGQGAAASSVNSSWGQKQAAEEEAAA